MSDKPTTPPSDAFDAAYQSTDDMASPTDSDANTLNQVQADLAALQAKSAELADQYLRAKADAENARRRAEGLPADPYRRQNQ